jgi:membrane protein
VWPFTSYRIVKRALQQFAKDRGGQTGAALAYYSLFSIAPLLVISIAIAGVALGEEEARRSALKIVRDNMTPEAATAVEEVLDHARKPSGGVWQAVLTAGLLFFGALGVFFQMRTAFGAIWGLPPPHRNSLLGLLLDYLLAGVMVLVTGLLLLASVATTTLLPKAAGWAHDRWPDLASGWPGWHLTEFTLSFFFLTVLFALVYRVMSGRHISLGFVLYGAVITALLFTGGKTLLGLYLSYANVASVYGAGGSVVAFLVWVYYSAQLMILGAELIQARRTYKQWMSPEAKT